MINRPLLLCSISLCLAGNAFATPVKFDISTDIGYIDESDKDLGLYDGGQNRNAFFQVNTKGEYRFTKQQIIFSRIKGFYSTDSINLELDEGDQPSKKYLELQEFYYRVTNLGAPGIYVDVGRKRLRDDTGLWWDKYFTQASLHINRSLFSGFIAVGEQLNSFRTDDSDYRQEDKDLFRLLAGTSWHWKYRHYLDFNFSYLNDHRSHDDVDSITSLRAEEFGNPNVMWLGVRPHGELLFTEDLTVKYSAQYIHQQGELSFHDVNRIDKNIEGWLVQGELITEFAYRFKPALGFQFAQTSDMSDDNTEGRFFQSGLHSNKVRFKSNIRPVSRYNDAYRPELANMRVLGAYLGLKLMPELNVNLLFNQFTRLNTALNIGYSRINAPLIEGEDDLGMAVDLVANFFPELRVPLLNKSEIQLRLSSFWPGDAYGQHTDNHRYRALLDWRINF